MIGWIGPVAKWRCLREEGLVVHHWRQLAALLQNLRHARSGGGVEPSWGIILCLW